MRENRTIVGVIAGWNEAMVQKIAKSYMQRDTKDRVIIDEDILSAGREGLLRAIDRFDYTKETRFASYAPYYVIQRIQAEIRGRMGLNAYEIRAAAKARHFYDVVYACGFKQPSQRELENVLLVFTDISPKLISRTVSANLHKRTKAISSELRDSSQDTEQEAIKGTIWSQLTPAMRGILRELPVVEREIVLMNIVQGKTVFEIAKERRSQPQDIQAILDAGKRTLRTTDQVRRAKQLRDAAQPAEVHDVYTPPSTKDNEALSPVRPKKTMPTNQLGETIDRFLLQGLSNVDVAREVGCSREYVRQRHDALIASGAMSVKQIRDEDIDTLLLSGHAVTEVRARFQCSWERVASRRKELLARRVLTLNCYTSADRQQLRDLATAENPELIASVRSHLSTHPLPSFQNIMDIRFRQQHAVRVKN